jgi:hypothetical protein
MRSVRCSRGGRPARREIGVGVDPGVCSADGNVDVEGVVSDGGDVCVDADVEEGGVEELDVWSVDDAGGDRGNVARIV